MVAVGNISMLKPNTISIPIDKDNDDIAVYLDKEFQFYIDIEGKGRLIYSVKPLTLDTEQKLITELNSIYKSQLYKHHLSENEELTPEVIAMIYNQNIFSDKSVDRLTVDYSTCLNPELILPELKGIFKAFDIGEVDSQDYYKLYDKLNDVGFYKKHWFPPFTLFHRLKTIHKLKRRSLDYLLYLANKVIDAYTMALLRHQEVYLKFKVLMNIVRYEREFKKKLLSLFLTDTQKMTPYRHLKDLDNSTLFLEQNADTIHNGNTIPVF